VRIIPALNAAFRFVHGDGSAIPLHEAPAPMEGDPIEQLRAHHRAAGITIDATTSFPSWDGRPADYDLIVWSLMLAGG
jgi:hypothetical protein